MKNVSSALLLIFFFISFNAFSQQKVGVNKTNPSQPLDVNGNVNIDGNLMVNGQAGQPGQVLKTNSSGATQWVDFSQFENVLMLTNGSSSFDVPAGITKIGVELQGGGGAGSNNGGGAGGNYTAFIKKNVTPGSNFAFTIGSGGSSTGTENGQFSTITIYATSYYAGGGNGAGSAQAGASNNFPAYLGDYISLPGQPGTANDYSYSYGPGGNTIYKIIYGAGGGTYPSYINTPGGTYVKNQTTSTDLHITTSTYPFTYGSGGAANKVLNSFSNGRGGYVRIYY